MKHHRSFHFTALILFFICLFAADASAGPHLRNLKLNGSIFNASGTRTILFILIAVSLVFIFYNRIHELIKKMLTVRALRKLAVRDSNFDWNMLKTRFASVITCAYMAWNDENMFGLSNECTKSFWEEQQEVNIDFWKEEGLLKRSQLNKIISVTPIFLQHSGESNGQDSKIVVGVKANAEEYLVKKQTGEVARGDQKARNIQTIWTFKLKKGRWLLHNIEQMDLWSVYINLRNEMPAQKVQFGAG